MKVNDDDYGWQFLEAGIGPKKYLVRIRISKLDGSITVEKVQLLGGSRAASKKSKIFKRIEAVVHRRLVPIKNPWEHIGGGCLVGQFAEGKRYPCDDDFENTETGEEINIRSTVEGHFTQPGRGKKVKRLAEIEKHPGVKKGSRRQIRKPGSKKTTRRKKNPTVGELVRRALK